MNKSLESMTYKEFRDYCNKRACDGRWNMEEAIVCIAIMEEINDIKIKGLFKKKQTEKAREEAWSKIKEKIK